jgi:hypothetical protein
MNPSRSSGDSDVVAGTQVLAFSTASALSSTANADDEHEDKGEREGRQDRDPLHGRISSLGNVR